MFQGMCEQDVGSEIWLEMENLDATLANVADYSCYVSASAILGKTCLKTC